MDKVYKKWSHVMYNAHAMRTVAGSKSMLWTVTCVGSSPTCSSWLGCAWQWEVPGFLTSSNTCHLLVTPAHRELHGSGSLIDLSALHSCSLVTERHC